MARLSPQELHFERLSVAQRFPRPSRCNGCIGNPSTEGHNPILSGGFVRPRWSLRSQLWAIGITGGVDEERLGKPLVGPSGWTLDAAISPEEHPNLKIGKWNVYNCRATKLGSPHQGPHVINRTQPTVKEMRDCCSRWLFPELKRAKGLVVPLILGTDAFKFIMAHRFDVFGKAMGHRLRIIQKDISPEKGLPWETFSYGERHSVEKVRRRK